MAGFYLDIYQRFPEFLKRRINPLEYGIRDVVREASQVSAGKVVLDAGAGETRFREAFRESLYVSIDSVVGDESWDYSRIDLIGNLLEIPIKDRSVDVVVNLQVLEHVKDPGRVILEFNRILKEGGELFLTAPQGWHEHQKPNDFFRFTRFALEELVLSAGFETCEIQPIGGFFHYLGHRLTYIPKVLFQSRKGLIRVVLFPLELVSLAVFCFLGPVVCYYLDRFDPVKDFTLCYRCRARK